MAGPNKAKKATKRGNRGMGKQAQRSATATSGQLDQETKQSIRTAMATFLEGQQNLLSQLKTTIQPFVGRTRRASTVRAKTGQNQNQGQGQRLAATG
jgi:hypothetical protein